MNKYNVLITTDNNYLPYSFVTCQSVINSIKHDFTNDKDTIVFNIFVDENVDISSTKQKCESFVNRNTSDTINIEFNIQSVTSSTFDGATEFHGGTLSAYYRLLAGKLLSPDIQTVLYLDCDTFVRNDIRVLFRDTNLDKFTIAGVIDYGMEYELERSSEIIVKAKSTGTQNLSISLKDYINSGVLLINLEEFRNQKILEQCLDIIKNYNLKAHDQDLLNLVIKKKAILPLTWNFTTFSYFQCFNANNNNFSLLPAKQLDGAQITSINTMPTTEEFIEISCNPSICHFTKFKPWGNANFNNTSLPLNKALTKILNEWYDTAKSVVEFDDQLKQLQYCPFKNHDFVICFLNEKIAQLQHDLYKQRSRRRNDRRILLSLMVALLIVQLVTVFSLYL